MITDINQLDFNKKYTYADYITWQFEEMVELIRGRIFKMSPAPNPIHQSVSGELFFQIKAYLKGKRCKVFHAPFDVRLPGSNEENTNTVVQPDISVVCDLDKIDHRGCNGAPDWIIEILSQSTAQKDLTEKFDLYQNSGVKEYWIVHPNEGTIIPYILDANQRYVAIRPNPFVTGEQLPVNSLPGFEVDLGEVFGG